MRYDGKPNGVVKFLNADSLLLLELSMTQDLDAVYTCLKLTFLCILPDRGRKDIQYGGNMFDEAQKIHYYYTTLYSAYYAVVPLPLPLRDQVLLSVITNKKVYCQEWLMGFSMLLSHQMIK